MALLKSCSVALNVSFIVISDFNTLAMLRNAPPLAQFTVAQRSGSAISASFVNLTPQVSKACKKAVNRVVIEGRGTRNRLPPTASSALWKILLFPLPSTHVMTPTKQILKGTVNPTEDLSEAHTL